MSSSSPHRKGWSKPSAFLRSLITERLRTMGERRAASSLQTGPYTMTALRDGGAVMPSTLERLEATAREQAFKVCGCGLCFTSAMWNELFFVGVQADEEDSLELRNCPCGSTLAVLIAVEQTNQAAAE